MQTYGRQVAEAILGLNGYCDAAKDLLVIDDRGISLSSAGESMPDLCWVPACELDGPDPLDVPSLPFPFSPEELAAFMIDGPGVVIPSVYGDLSDGPHEC